MTDYYDIIGDHARQVEMLEEIKNSLLLDTHNTTVYAVRSYETAEVMIRSGWFGEKRRTERVVKVTVQTADQNGSELVYTHKLESEELRAKFIANCHNDRIRWIDVREQIGKMGFDLVKRHADSTDKESDK